MEFTYSLVWNDNWNFVLIIIFNRNISVVKMGKSKKIYITNKTYAKICMTQLQKHHLYGMYLI